MSQPHVWHLDLMMEASYSDGHRWSWLSVLPAAHELSLRLAPHLDYGVPQMSHSPDIDGILGLPRLSSTQWPLMVSSQGVPTCHTLPSSSSFLGL